MTPVSPQISFFSPRFYPFIHYASPSLHSKPQLPTCWIGSHSVYTCPQVRLPDSPLSHTVPHTAPCHPLHLFTRFYSCSCFLLAVNPSLTLQRFFSLHLFLVMPSLLQCVPLSTLLYFLLPFLFVSLAPTSG